MINDVLCQLLGEREAEIFWNEYRDTYITRDDIRFIKSLGLNSIRVPFNWRLFMADGDSVIWSGPGFEMLDRVVRWCSEAGLWVILDMHCAPGGQTGDNIDDSWGYPYLYESSKNQERTTELWQRIAARYSNERTVIGYDLLNEPIATYFDKDKLNPYLEPLYRKIVAAIRTVDTNHVVFLGGAQWDTNFGVFGPPFDRKVVYTFHKYWCDTTQSMVQEYVDFRERYRVPIWMGESGENSNEWIASWRKLQDRNNIGWCFWPFKKLDSSRGVLSIAMPQHWDTIVHFANASRSSYKSVRQSRPDPQLVKQVLKDYLKAAKFENCKLNKGYIESLGLDIPK
jgi:aryl-phospho-beta-D-glucosidase BglC (GH1 family)